jgi:uncharacterized phiE125 gp8 family phage protein
MPDNRVTIQPTSEPVTIQEIKAQLNIDLAFNLDDNFLSSCITTARIWVEGRTGKSLMPQTRVQYMDCFPMGKIVLSNGPVLTSDDDDAYTDPVVKYYDSADAEQTWATSNYWLDLNNYEPRIVPKYSWPSVGDRPSAVSVTYMAGHITVRETTKSAIKLLVANMYTNRVPEVEQGNFSSIKHGVEMMLAFETQWIRPYAERY